MTTLIYISLALFLLILLYFEREAMATLLNPHKDRILEQYKFFHLYTDIIKVFTDGFVWISVACVIAAKSTGDYIPIFVMMFVLLLVTIPFCYAKIKNMEFRYAVHILMLIASVALSRLIASFLMLVMMNYFFGLELYVFNI